MIVNKEVLFLKVSSQDELEKEFKEWLDNEAEIHVLWIDNPKGKIDLGDIKTKNGSACLYDDDWFGHWFTNPNGLVGLDLVFLTIGSSMVETDWISEKDGLMDLCEQFGIPLWFEKTKYKTEDFTKSLQEAAPNGKSRMPISAVKSLP